MAVWAEAGGIARRVGRPNETPLSLRSFRGVSVSAHAMSPDAPWLWEARENDGGEIALLALTQAPMVLTAEHGSSVAEHGFFLRPQVGVTVQAREASSMLCVWVPWDALDELDDGRLGELVVSMPTPLTAGLRAFATAVLSRQSTPSAYTDYLVEKLLVEMVFGVALEACGVGPERGGESRGMRPVQRARTIMLLRRGDPTFGVGELARELHFSTRQLQRVFAAEGSSPTDELRRMRVELAQQLLANPDYEPLTVEEIATHAGFGTAAALRRALAAQGLPLPRRRT